MLERDRDIVSTIPDTLRFSLRGLKNGSTVQTPTVDDVKDDNPVWLDPRANQQVHVSRGQMFLSQDRADNLRRERVAPENV